MTLEVDFKQAVDKTMATKEVVDALADPSRRDELDFLRPMLLEDEVEVRGLIAPLIQEYEEIESAIGEILYRNRAFMQPSGWAAALQPIASILFLLAIASVIGWLAGSNFAWDFVRQVFTSPPITFAQIGLGFTLLMILIASGQWLRWRLVHLPVLQADFASDSHLKSKRAELVAQKNLVYERLLDLVKASAFEIIGRLGPPFFQTRLVREADPRPKGAEALKVSSPSGLSEVADKTHEAPTIARREILHLVNELPGASIGLSGPRGAGKSTILRSLTEANLPLQEHGKVALTIYTAAPVEYEARDFLLHIFATLCRRVLRTQGTSEEQDGDRFAQAEGAGADWSAKIEGMAPFLLWLGIVFTAFALVITQLSRMPVFMAANAAGAGQVNLLQAIDFKPGPLLLFGLSALLMGAALRLYSRFGRRRDTTPLPQLPVPVSFVAALRYWFFRRDPAPLPAESELISSTRRELRDIRFQRSFTEGWSGSIKIPAGFDLGSTSSTLLAQRQESFPELVDRFCRYVAKIAEEYGAVVIAVDELDKLKTAEEAEKFINGVKSIFSIPKCFYLISVSEDALSAFERRGLSLRDAFDSAFDDIRYIGYKHLPGSRHMLARRILSLPDPFLCLCHTLSGGLPRDLIRIARAMFQTAAQSARKPAALKDVARRLVQQEAAAKIRASRTAIRSVTLEPEVGNFSAALADLEDCPLGTAPWRARLKKLEAKPRVGADPAAFARLVSIQREIAAYLEFLDVTLLLADRLSTRSGWEMAVEKDVESLARARQALESSVSVGLIRLAKVRSALGARRYQAPAPA